MSTYKADAAPAELAGKIANTIRFLSADGVQAAKSGHPGMPMGCADIATVLLTRFLRIDPNDTNWFNRDRFVLSAGHGSMLLYSMLHLAGYLELDELKNFRQLHSKTPGHPEYGDVPGCDCTAGPLGYGFAAAAGMSLAERMLAARYSDTVSDHYTYVIMGDGCNMEGVSNETASLAGHLKLGKLIAFYDDNEISIEGSTDLAFTEDVQARYKAMGWHVQDVADGQDQDAIAAAIEAAQADERPSLIVCHTTIGFGAPHEAGTAKVHGEPLGEEELAAAKENLNWSPEKFYVPQDVYDYFTAKKAEWSEIRKAHDAAVEAFAAEQPEAAAELKRTLSGQLPEGWEDATPHFDADVKGMATRASGGKVMNAFGAVIPELVGGSADLAPSTKTIITEGKWPEFIAPGEYAGRNIHFGVREHAMGDICLGLALHGGFRPFCATFMVFHDYMRPALRLAAIQKLPVIFVYTHDSFFVGEDGPTHQPIEHIAAMRAIPRVHVMRPGDANEAAYAWQYALKRTDGPTVMALTRQNLPTLDRENMGCACGTLLGGYVLSDDDGAEILMIASGSEVSLALDAAGKLREKGKKVRVVSMPSPKLFAEQPAEYREKVIPAAVKNRVVLEAGIKQGWEGYLGENGVFVGREDFGLSAPYTALVEEFGFTPDAVVARCEKAGF